MNADIHIRLTTFGPSRLELDCAEQTEVISLRRREKLRGVLALLLCASERTLPRAELARALYDHEQEGRERLEDILNNRSISRVHPCLTREVFFAEIDHVRVTLPAQERFWWDADAFLTLVEEAGCCDEPQRALLLWQQAEALIARGTFLSDDVAAPWREQRIVRRKQEKIDRARRQMLRGLGLSMLALGDAEKAHEYFCDYFQELPSDFHTLEQCMGGLARLQRPDLALHLSQEVELHLARKKIPLVLPPSLRSLGKQFHLGQFEQGTHLSQFSSSKIILGDEKERQALQYQNGSFYPSSFLQDEEGKEQAMIEGDDTMPFLTRRDLFPFLGLAGIAASMEGSIFELPEWEQVSQQGSRKEPPLEATVLAQEQVINACWQLCDAGQFSLAQRLLQPLIETREAALKHQTLARLQAEALRLQSILFAHSLRMQEKVIACLESVRFARLSRDPNTLLASLRQFATALRYTGQEKQMLPVFLEAQLYCNEPTVAPTVRAGIHAGTAVALAYQQRHKEAEFYLQLAWETIEKGDAEQSKPSLAEIDQGKARIAGNEALLALVLGEPKRAWTVLVPYTNNASAATPERNRLEMVNYQSRAALLMGDRECYVTCLRQGLEGAIALQSKKRYAEAITTLKKEIPHSWHQDAPIRAVKEEFGLLREEVQ
ncbi:DNA-binding SARP family transcriptional activator [Thermosporothrix hazakensis]|jgi:tetratricopeptide (TPR) repeat protein|uniref:DNA-binding SARP family transcriptional activator n=1 Tax=Thermosporothrix hazakensis TaxID=644383 RepID=A0A326U3H3_THEHA|nr:bacterial transcriptional activator domain-containing protein [Thermosporothrix hazakensis]PZW26054.1 DNA-binding SARP family transcriptional activator [Thermosporothrix hazakensis]GCE51313.1 hypothetical protein KTH_61820 [Thermosporothrix hazakensis]